MDPVFGAVLVALIAATPPSILGFLAYKTSQNAVTAAMLAAAHATEAKDTATKTGEAVDGMKSELVAAVKSTARAEGVVEGRKEGASDELAIAGREADAHASGVLAGVQTQIDRDTPPRTNGNGAPAPLQVIGVDDPESPPIRTTPSTRTPK